jgi:hypothetical protein
MGAGPKAPKRRSKLERKTLQKTTQQKKTLQKRTRQKKTQATGQRPPGPPGQTRKPPACELASPHSRGHRLQVACLSLMGLDCPQTGLTPLALLTTSPSAAPPPLN